MIHVIKRGFLIGARSDLIGGLSPIIQKANHPNILIACNSGIIAQLALPRW